MFLTGLWQLLHLFFAFSFVGSLVVSEWNGRAARVTQDWSQRALLFGIVHFSTRIGGFGALLLTGVFGNLASQRLGYRMAEDAWARWVNGLWIVALVVALFVQLPHAARLASISRAAAAGGPADGYASALARWRFGNVVQSVLYLALLVLMVFRWRS